MRTLFKTDVVANRLIFAGLCALGMLALQGCQTMEMPKPKYPVYMQDKPVEAPDTPAPVAQAQLPAPVQETAPAVSPPSSTGGITTTELEPPPPPPPPPAAVAQTPVPAPAPVQRPATPAPAVSPANPRAVYAYTLQAHDTLYGVSRRFGIPVKELYDLNGLSAASTFHVGQRILLPGTASDKGAEAHANGATMTKLPSAIIADATPAPRPVAAAPKPVTATPKPAPVQASAPAKPVVTPPAQTTLADSTPAKPTVTPPVQKPAATPQPVTPPVAGFPANAQLAQMGKGLFVWPVKGRILVPFGQLAPNVRNDGINIQASTGTQVVAASDGIVVYEGDQVKELGNTVYIKHPNGWYTGYSHLQTMNVKNNERVTRGQVIGTVGATGVIDQPQLHFEIRYTPSSDIARPIDPHLVLP